ncbi:MAG: hypothetical protein ACXAEN_20480 [Candidatus Thorarchaeota archaeon]|jgi:hypothetical protein
MSNVINKLVGVFLVGLGSYILLRKASAADALNLEGERCPAATQNVLLNTENRNEAIKNPLIGYGPANPTVENAEFWNGMSLRRLLSPKVFNQPLKIYRLQRECVAVTAWLLM